MEDIVTTMETLIKEGKPVRVIMRAGGLVVGCVDGLVCHSDAGYEVYRVDAYVRFSPSKVARIRRAETPDEYELIWVDFAE